jgi:ribosome recycling factor
MQTVFKTAEEKMAKTVSVLASEYGAIRAGRANAAVLDKIQVDYYGCPTPINQMAAISVPEARILAIQPWDMSTLSLIEKAILASDIGINPSNDGRIIRLVFPALTEERRKQLSKEVSQLGEEAKVGVRNIRRDCIDKIKAMKKNSEITEDEQKISEKDVQTLTDNYIAKIEKITEQKNKDIMSI